MARKYPVYKGLQQPLIFKGFRGKFIYWGIASLLIGLVFGALAMTLINMWLGAIILVGFIVGGLLFTAAKQKGGLHAKSRASKTFILNRYGRKKPL